MKQIITASAGGVDLEKYYDESELPVPAVVYEIRSERQDTVEIRIVESVPDGLEKDQIGFHGEFTRDVWTVENERLIFDHLIEGESAYRTVYALKPNSPFETEELVTEPVELDIEPAGHAKEFVSGDPTWSVESAVIDDEPSPSEADATGEPSTGETDADSTGSEQTADPSGGQQTRTDDGTDGFADIFAEQGDERSSEPTTDGTPSKADGGAGSSDGILDVQSPSDSEPTAGESPAPHDAAVSGETNADSDSVVEQLVSEIRSGAVPEEDIEYLRRELGATTEVPKSVEARINKLQSDVADLQAYTDALERFIDTHGQAEDAVDSFERRLDDIDEKVEELSAVTGELEEQMPADDIEQRFEELEDEIEDLSEFTSSLKNAFGR